MRLRNMKKIPLILFLVLFFSFCSLSFGQTGPTLDLQLAPSLELAQIVYVSDFDFIQQGAHQFLFQLTVDNTGRGSVEGLLRFEIFQNENILAETETQPFTLTANENFSIIIFMVIIATLLTPPMLRAAFTSNQPGSNMPEPV